MLHFTFLEEPTINLPVPEGSTLVGTKNGVTAPVEELTISLKDYGQFRRIAAVLEQPYRFELCGAGIRVRVGDATAHRLLHLWSAYRTPLPDPMQNVYANMNQWLAHSYSVSHRIQGASVRRRGTEHWISVFDLDVQELLGWLGTCEAEVHKDGAYDVIVPDNPQIKTITVLRRQSGAHKVPSEVLIDCHG